MVQNGIHENKGQICICPIITFIKAFPFTRLNRWFCYSFRLYYKKKSCLSVRGETTIYSTTMCDISLEGEFIYLLYGISQVQIG